MTITETSPGVRGDTSGRVLKPATTETGAKIQVPIFVEEGEKIKVDTRTGEYVSRANDLIFYEIGPPCSQRPAHFLPSANVLEVDCCALIPDAAIDSNIDVIGASVSANKWAISTPLPNMR